jgi:hypothetical protein
MVNMTAEVWRNNSWCGKTVNGIAELGGDLISYLLQQGCGIVTSHVQDKSYVIISPCVLEASQYVLADWMHRQEEQLLREMHQHVTSRI